MQEAYVNAELQKGSSAKRPFFRNLLKYSHSPLLWLCLSCGDAWLQSTSVWSLRTVSDAAMKDAGADDWNVIKDWSYT